VRSELIAHPFSGQVCTRTGTQSALRSTWKRARSRAVASTCGLCETRTSLRRHAMKKTGSEMPSADDSSPGNEGSAEIIERARLQADVAQQRVRLAKDELRRARQRLKEAKREAKRARKYASLARKDWKRARRQAKKDGSTEGQQKQTVTAKRRRKPKAKLASARSRRATTRGAKRSGRGSRARAAK
jgi:hypothetical protein